MTGAAEVTLTSSRRWLVTGAAGFIGSHLVQNLLARGQEVIGVDNFLTGFRHNLEDVRGLVEPEAWSRFTFVDGDIVDLQTCREVCSGVDVVLHHAALGSVPRSVADPLSTHANNLTGFLNVIAEARAAGVRRFVYAGSSSTYGDSPDLPKVEDRIGRPLSPYAVTKYANELYARVFSDVYGMETVGLRYFNVFGPRQDPNGAYAAVIPRWTGNLLNGQKCVINGDGKTTRDFSFVANIVQANLRAATEPGVRSGEVYNVGCGGRTSLDELFVMIREGLANWLPALRDAEPEYGAFQPGDIRDSQADISKIQRDLHYLPTHSVQEGLAETVEWYVNSLAPKAALASRSSASFG